MVKSAITRHCEWEVLEALLRIKGLRFMYHSVNMSYVLISIDGESEEVTILSKFFFPSGSTIIGGFQWMR